MRNRRVRAFFAIASSAFVFACSSIENDLSRAEYELASMGASDAGERRAKAAETARLLDSILSTVSPPDPLALKAVRLRTYADIAQTGANLPAILAASLIYEDGNRPLTPFKDTFDQAVEASVVETLLNTAADRLIPILEMELPESEKVALLINSSFLAFVRLISAMIYGSGRYDRALDECETRLAPLNAARIMLLTAAIQASLLAALQSSEDPISRRLTAFDESVAAPVEDPTLVIDLCAVLKDELR